MNPVVPPAVSNFSVEVTVPLKKEAAGSSEVFVLNTYDQMCANSGRQVRRFSKFCTVAPNMCGSSVWNLLHVSLLTSSILRFLLHFSKLCVPLPTRLRGVLSHKTAFYSVT